MFYNISIRFNMKLKKLVDSANTTKTALAKAAGVSLTALSNYEKGKNSPTLKVLIKMSEHLKCSLEMVANYNTENIIDKRMLNEEKQKLIEEVLNLDSNKTSSVLAFIEVINSQKK